MTATAAPGPGRAAPTPTSDRPAPSRPGRVVRLGRSSGLVLAVTSALGLVGFLWPLFTTPEGSANLAHAGDAPWLFAALLPLLLAVLLAELAEGSLDAKAVAMLGVLAACASVLRLPGGIAGFEPMFFLFIPAGRVLGRGFGFVLGALAMVASALITGGVGPWLPFQMVGAAWIGFFAGCLPPARGRVELAVLAAYAFVTGLAYGALMNMWFWPFSTAGTEVSFVPGDPLADNLARFWAFHVATSFGWDLPRAAVNAVLVLVAGRPVLAALRRASRRAAFGVPARFTPGPAPGAAMMSAMSSTDGVTPDHPSDEGLTEPTLPIEDVEGARLLANEVRGQLRADGFDDGEIEGWVRVYFEQGHEGDAAGLLAFIRAEQAEGRGPTR